jgi:hypothetical protein
VQRGRPKRFGGVENMGKKGPIRQAMEHLGQIGVHALALPGCENNDVEKRHQLCNLKPRQPVHAMRARSCNSRLDNEGDLGYRPFLRSRLMA